jgi:nitrilase
MKIAAAQIRPYWLDKRRTTDLIISTVQLAASQGIKLVAFPEAFLSGYPFWICRTNGAAFGDLLQQRAYSQFLEAAVEIPSIEISRITEACRDHGVSIYLGTNERGSAAGKGTIYCSLLAISADNGLVGVHRKLIPTYDERLCWAYGDAHGLRVHDMGGIAVGGLNCWENWMPLARFSMYSGGEDLHISTWPGNAIVSDGVVKTIALEGRVWSLSVSGLLSIDDIPDDFVFKNELVAQGLTTIFNGGSSLVDPSGKVVIDPVMGEEGLIVHDIDLNLVREQRQNFDPTGHYHRPDIFRIDVNFSRHEVLTSIGE